MFRQHNRHFNNQRNQFNQRRKSAVPQGPRVVIPLKPDFSLSESRTVKFSISLPAEDEEGAYEKTVVEVPKLTDDATPMQALNFVREFFSACETMLCKICLFRNQEMLLLIGNETYNREILVPDRWWETGYIATFAALLGHSVHRPDLMFVAWLATARLKCAETDENDCDRLQTYVR
ncbi:hypothetical protein IV203_013329 [Nitzschia inconspicua]|uniref:Uncharacterized protein n=1 Tax=Nitzschia inconspicua TaxID=303405 RepID=A0A9K3QA32_9STRA|nr:hypothetical protein IV203_013329 [Nitzschia inconspicua]